MKFNNTACLAILYTLSAGLTACFAQAPGALQQVHEQGKFAFVVFHSDNSAPSQQMLAAAKSTVAAGQPAGVVLADLNSADGQKLAEQFQVTRAPMPMTVVVAPNGAVTGLFPRQVTEAKLAAAIVPPVMMQCMKELQAQKLVFVCLTRTEKASIPAGVQQLQLDPMFKDRIALVGLHVEDAAEAKLMQQLKVNAAAVQGPYVAVIAPPGVLVGHFNGTATADQIAAAIHKAGQCCDDPNCKHANAPQASQSTPNRR